MCNLIISDMTLTVGKWDFAEFTLLGYWPVGIPYASKSS
jgi:hypothetical protein